MCDKLYCVQLYLRSHTTFSPRLQTLNKRQNCTKLYGPITKTLVCLLSDELSNSTG